MDRKIGVNIIRTERNKSNCTKRTQRKRRNRGRRNKTERETSIGK